MNLAKHLHALLLQHETVIVPGFGAFISSYKPAEIIEETNEIFPPSKEITFSPKIRNNDGLLVGYVAELHSVSHFDALKIIEKERENMIYRLDKGEQIVLENIGVLFRNEKNVTELTQHIKENLLLDSFGLETVSLDEEEQEQENVSVDNQIVIPDEEDKIDAETLDDENTAQPEIETEEEQIVEESVSGGDEKVADEDIAQTSPEEIGEKKDEKIPEFEAESAMEFVAKEEPDEKRKRKAWLWILLVFIPLIAVGIFLGKDKFLQKSGDVGVVQNETSESISVPQEIKTIPDSATDDSSQVLPVDTAEQIVPENIQVETSEPEKPKFYLVGGSFKEEENANKFIEQFDAEGYEPFLLGKRGNFYIVVIGTYPSEREAVVARDSFMSQNPGSEAWVPDDGVFE